MIVTRCSKTTIAMILVIVIMALVGCNGKDKGASSAEAIALIQGASQQRDYNRILVLVDSLDNTGDLSIGDSYFWRGYAYYRMPQILTAEFYWKEAILATENSTDEASLLTYAKSASYLTNLLCRDADYSRALKVALPVVSRLEQLNCDTTSHYMNLVVFIGCCKSYFNTSDSIIDIHFNHAYQKHCENIARNPTRAAYHDAITGLINITYSIILISDTRSNGIDKTRYKRALPWMERMGDMLRDYNQLFPDDSVYFDRQKARYNIYRAITLEGMGYHTLADAHYTEFMNTNFSKSFEGVADAGDYLIIAGHWKEAAAVYQNLESYFTDSQTEYSLENIHKYLLKKYQANAKAGYQETADIVANNICEHLDSAVMKSRWRGAEEQETIREKENQIAKQQLRLSNARMTALCVSIVTLSAFFIIFTTIRNRAGKRLARVNAAKERLEGELSIARDIQMSMVPNTFPKIEGLDMYASMTPAKEVGGDLYGYLLKGNRLYFCVGDVSGKGVPASLFMAQATRLFHTLASQEMMPAEICTRMNIEMAEDNEQGMFITMFIGLLDLQTGHLDFSNAGHNAPIIGGGEHDGDFLDMESNAPIGLWPNLEYVGEEIDSIKGRVLFIYTDGLNEAENTDQQQFGDNRLLDFLRQTHFTSAQQVIETLADAVNQHRNGAEPNDDLTMMCIKLS
jgi:serine phosphatase RsbU (regulator of sigma subunit)